MSHLGTVYHEHVHILQNLDNNSSDDDIYTDIPPILTTTYTTIGFIRLFAHHLTPVLQANLNLLIPRCGAFLPENTDLILPSPVRTIYADRSASLTK